MSYINIVVEKWILILYRAANFTDPTRIRCWLTSLQTQQAVYLIAILSIKNNDTAYLSGTEFTFSSLAGQTVIMNRRNLAFSTIDKPTTQNGALTNLAYISFLGNLKIY